MTTAVAAPPVTAPLAPPSIEQPTANSSRYAPIAPSNGATPSAKSSRSSPNHGSPTSSNGSAHRQMPESKRSPTSTRNSHAPKIVVKKEPTSPEMPTASRHRPRRLDLSNNMYTGSGALSARPSGSLTAKDSAGLGMQDVGLACLSPGFHTQDPTMREQLQRSIDVRDRQRQIIEARQKGGKTTNITLDNVDGTRHVEVSVNPFRNGKGPATSRRKGPPPGLSIAPPSAQQFANERVIQSAPLNQSFTGMRGSQFQNLSRQVANQPSNLSQSSHIHHVPANQTNNRLPPISDVFAGESLGAPQREQPQRTNTSPSHSSHSNQQQPLPSPSFPPSAPPQQTFAARPREYKSAEEAVQSMSGGREDLLPRIVHYGGHQPPTPPSPMPPRDHKGQTLQAGINPELRSGSSRRRTREEYERDMGTPPLGRQEAKRSGPFGEGRDSPETQRRKKEEFIALCARAWDLFHS